MQIYFFTAGVDSDELNELESRIRGRLPALQKLTKLEEVTKRLTEQAAAPGQEPAFIIFPVLTTTTSFERLVSIAERTQRGIFFIFVSREISATDYKRLVRSGGADWVSLKGAPQEVEDIIARASRVDAAPAGVGSTKPTIAVFLPSSGGVGNTTLALETAVQFKLDKQTRHRRVCLLDLDLQTSHACDYLDIEPRLQMREIVDTPERLDAQLFDLFVSHHSTGLDVLASPRGRQNPVELQMAALDALFGMIASRYDTLIIDLPPQWSAWTRQIVSVGNLAVVSGLNTVPGLRQIADTLQDVRSVEPVPAKIVVALNRCESRLLGGVARAQHIQKILGNETVLTVREDTAAATHALNTGIPLAISHASSKITKDIRALRAILAEVPAQSQVTSSGA
jgi:pilus assembly protein CpaE